jgi:hypothetical protein
MAKRTQKRGKKAGNRRAKTAGRKAAAKRSVKRQKKTAPKRRVTATKARKAPRKASKPRQTASRKAAAPVKTPRLDRARRTLEDVTIPSPPSSLDMNRHGSAARSGRAEMLGERAKTHGMNAITAGDVDVNAEDAFFTGDEAPGGDNPTPDQDVVDDIGRAVGVQYQDDEELQGGDEVAKRDQHRWEMDPASSEDYKGRKNS